VKFDWIGLKDRYFCTIFKPEVSPSGYYSQLIDNKVVNVGIPLSILKLEPRASAKFKAKLFAGPLNTQVLNETDSNFGQIINFGVFDSISKVLLSTLRFIHKILPNWGVCIIVLSCLLFFILYPLTLKSLKSMKAMQALQPEMEKMRQQHKDQPQKFNKEVMELYKKHHVNPFGGCLPMVLQIPIFIGLYQALLRSLELRGSGFLWIRDLSEADRLFIFPYNIPILGNELNILPILMAIIMFLQQKLTSKTTVSANPEQQRIMLIFFPILFGFMFYRMPSGLVLYWFVYSGLSFIFQWKQMAATPSE
jgi:YidC/Oxa1 family membrane protein insertase